MFAAIAPICGAGSVAASALAGTPLWAFHGANDIVVLVRVTDNMVERIQDERARSGDTAAVKYTRCDESPAPTGWGDYTGHASWLQAYEGPELWDWMLQQTL
jgi:predicted peptidase